MKKIWGYLVQRAKHELSEVHSRMRQRQKLRIHYLIAEENNVQISSTRALYGLVLSPEQIFYPEEPGHHLLCAYLPNVYLRDHIQKICRACDPDRLRFVDRRKLIDNEARLHQSAYGQEKVSRSIAEIRP